MTDPTATLHLPANMHYECIQCGRSCGEFWEIPVDPEMSASIRARPLEKLAAARDPRAPVVVPSAWTPGEEVMRLHDKICCLRSNDNLCTLHAVFGFGSKPNRCRSFPYRFIETPGGTFAGLSFACTAVLGDLGPAVTEQRGELENLFSYTHSRRAVREPLELTADLPLTWEQYVGLEEDLNALLEPALGPIGLRLRAQAVYVQLLVKFLREQRAQKRAVEAGPEFNALALEVFRRKMRGTSEAAWALPIKLAQRGKSSPLLRRMILGTAHTLRNTYGRRRGRLASYVSFVSQYLRHAFGRGIIEMPALPRPVHYAELRAVRFDPQRPEFNELLTRYFRHTLERKDLLTGDSVQVGIHMQLLHWGLIHWYGAALAAAEGAPEVSLEHLREGLRGVEKFFVYHSTFPRLFSSYPMLRSFMDYLFGHPRYLFSMGSGEWER